MKVCRVCGKILRSCNNSLYCRKCYKKSDGGKASEKKYGSSDKNKKCQERYRKSSIGKNTYIHWTKNNPIQSLAVKYRKLAYASLQSKGFRKNTKSETMRGCTKEEFFSYVGQKPEGDFHLDHICPCAQAQNEEELIKLFHYTNFRWLPATENQSKLDKKTTEGEENCRKLLGREWIEV